MALDTMRKAMTAGANTYAVTAETMDYRTWSITATKDDEPVAMGRRKDGSGIMRRSITWKGSAKQTAVVTDHEMETVMQGLFAEHVYDA